VHLVALLDRNSHEREEEKEEPPASLDDAILASSSGVSISDSPCSPAKVIEGKPLPILLSQVLEQSKEDESVSHNMPS
jgi:hypothetical protein